MCYEVSLIFFKIFLRLDFELFIYLEVYFIIVEIYILYMF